MRHDEGAITQTGKQFPAVDLIKYICALLVVAIHIAPLSSFFDQCQISKNLNYGIQHYLARIGVPFYFAAAGFFLFRKIDFDSIDFFPIKDYIFRLLRLLGTWTVLLFIGNKHQLWYIGGLVIAVCFLSVLLQIKVPFRKMAIFASLLYIIGLLGDSYFGLLRPLRNWAVINYTIKAYTILFGTTRNGLFMGFPFLLIGGAIQKKNISMKPHTALLGFIASMVALFFEAFLIKKWDLPKDRNMYVFLVPTVFFLLVFAVNVPLKQRSIYRKLRNVSVIVFFSHLFVYQWICWGWEIVDRLCGVKIQNSLLDYFLTVVLATTLGIVIDRLSRKTTLSFLKYLYS